MDLVRLLEAFRERCAQDVDFESERSLRQIDAAAWLATQAVDVGPRVCVAALVTDPSARVLLVRSRRREGWEMPGGKKRPGESWRTALVREVLEETGVPVKIDNHEAIDAGPDDGITCETLIIVARCSAGFDAPKAGSDAIEARWFAPEALPVLAGLPTARILREWAGAW